MAFFIYFDAMSFICLNGKFMPATEPVLLPGNRSYRYGDGLFETMKVKEGQIVLAGYHFDRLYKGLHLLKYEMPALFLRQRTENEILTLCRKNRCEKLARVRLSVFRGNGGLYDNDRSLQYLVECWPLDETNETFNVNGLVIGIFPDAKKSCDRFSNLKSASFLPYVMASVYAKEHQYNDCVVLNTDGRIADTTIANLFIIKNNLLCTPLLSEGCIDGVMRRHLLATLPAAGYNVSEKPLTIQDLETADEIFLTNAIRGIRWVARLGNSHFTCIRSTIIYRQIFQPSQQ